MRLLLLLCLFAAACNFEHLASEKVDRALREISRITETTKNNRFGVYISANELNRESLIEITTPPPSKSVHIGVGIGGSLDIAAWRRSEFIIIADYNSENKRVINMIKKLILKDPSKNRQGFATDLAKELQAEKIKVGEDIFNRSVEQRIFDQLDISKSPYSWLAQDARFEHIKNIIEKGRMVAITVDLSDVDQLSEIKTALSNHELNIDTIYLSNLRFFIKESEQTHLAQALSLIAGDTSYILSCPDVLPFGHKMLAKDFSLPIANQRNSRWQSIIRGAELKTSPALLFLRDAVNALDKPIINPF